MLRPFFSYRGGWEVHPPYLSRSVRVEMFGKTESLSFRFGRINIVKGCGSDEEALSATQRERPTSTLLGLEATRRAGGPHFCTIRVPSWGFRFASDVREQ
jgi:hypothetical protein